MSLVLTSLINNLFIMKSRDLSCYCLTGSTSRPYNKIVYILWIFTQLSCVADENRILKEVMKSMKQKEEQREKVVFCAPFTYT